MTLSKDLKGSGMPWEAQYGYAQAVKVDDTNYVSGRLSHDDRWNMVGAAPLDDSGRIRDYSNMEAQMRQTYANAEKPRDPATLTGSLAGHSTNAAITGGTM